MAHHPRRERRRLASASPASCPGAGSVDVTGADVQAPQYAETPRPSRPSAAPTLAAQLETEIPPRRTSPRSLKYWAASGPVSEATLAGRCVRSGRLAPRAGGRLSAAAGCGEHTVRWSPAVTATGVGATIGTVAERSSGAGYRRDPDVAVALVRSGAFGTIALEKCDRHAAGLVRRTGRSGLARVEQAPAPPSAEEQGADRVAHDAGWTGGRAGLASGDKRVSRDRGRQTSRGAEAGPSMSPNPRGHAYTPPKESGCLGPVVTTTGT